MTDTRIHLMALLVALGLAVPAVAQEFGAFEDEGDAGLYEDNAGLYEDEVGIAEDDFGFEWDQSFLGDEGLYGDSELASDKSYGTASDFGLYQGAYASDEYGAYDANYDWTTNDTEFDSWYGESDEGWF